MSLQDKVAIITGASRGIGKAIAEEYASKGAKVVVVSRSQEQCDQVAKELSSSYGVATKGVQTDVSDIESVKNLIKVTLEEFGKIDILINNAGITKDNLLMRLSEDDWDQVIDINLKSVFLTTKAVIRPMLKAKGGRIINVTSVVGVMGNQGQANYAASKAGIIGFSKSVAKEYGSKGIVCNAIAPGFIETDMTDSLPEEYLENIMKDVPLRRLGKPKEIAALAAFLGTDEAGYITGQTLIIDGGIRM